MQINQKVRIGMVIFLLSGFSLYSLFTSISATRSRFTTHTHRNCM